MKKFHNFDLSLPLLVFVLSGCTASVAQQQDYTTSETTYSPSHHFEIRNNNGDLSKELVSKKFRLAISKASYLSLEKITEISLKYDPLPKDPPSDPDVHNGFRIKLSGSNMQNVNQFGKLASLYINCRLKGHTPKYSEELLLYRSQKHLVVDPALHQLMNEDPTINPKWLERKTSKVNGHIHHLMFVLIDGSVRWRYKMKFSQKKNIIIDLETNRTIVEKTANKKSVESETVSDTEEEKPAE